MKLFRKKYTQYTDEELMALLSTRSRNEALSELYARYAEKVLGFFIRIFRGDVEKAQDFTQDLFLRILDRHHLFDPQRRFYPWMFSVASNMAKTSFRSKPEESLESEGDAAGWVWNEGLLDRAHFHSELQRVIDALEDHHRQTFILRYLQELSVRDIAEITEVSEGTVKSRLYYATRKISEKLEEFNPKSDGLLFKIH